VDIIGVQIGQQHVKDYFDDESDKLRKTAEEVRLKPSLACPPGLQSSFIAHNTSWCTHAAVCRGAMPMNVVAAAHIKDLLMQAKAEVDRMAQLQMDRSSLAFGSAMVCSCTSRLQHVIVPCASIPEGTACPYQEGQVDVAWDVKLCEVHASPACAGGHQPVGR
jgi:hypothetical protein